MSRWIEQFKTHPFNADWTRLTEILGAPLADEKNATVEVAQEYARLCKVVEYIKGVLENLDPELLPQAFLGNMHGYVQNAVHEVNAFMSNGSLGHLQNANSHADHLMVFACQGPFTAFGTVKATLTKAAVQYAEAMKHHAVAYASRTDGFIEESAGKLSELNQ